MQSCNHCQHTALRIHSAWLSYAGFRLACRSPLCRYVAWSIACCFRVAALSGNTALALSPSGIAPKLNRIQLSAICRGGQSGKVIDLLAWRSLPLGHPSAASGACAVEQISSSKRQCGKRQVSLKPALMCKGPNKQQISRAIWATGIKTMRAFKFFFRVRFGFSNIFYTSGIEMSQHFQGPSGQFVLTFCGPNLRAIGPRTHFISTPVCTRVLIEHPLKCTLTSLLRVGVGRLICFFFLIFLLNIYFQIQLTWKATLNYYTASTSPVKVQAGLFYQCISSYKV